MGAKLQQEIYETETRQLKLETLLSKEISDSKNFRDAGMKSVC